MPELLFELGCEELPASFVAKAFQDLERDIVRRLAEARLEHGPTRSMGTPRRLIVQVQDLASRQPDAEKELRGPSLQAAFDAEGNPTKALEGFCRGQGVDVADVRRDGDYVWVTKRLEGKPTAEVLAEILPAAVRALSFEKSMRWGSGKMRFARPIRWMLAAFEGKHVKFEVEGLKSGIKSRGHRFYANEAFDAKTLDTLLTGLRKRKVEPDPTERERLIREGATRVASGQPELTDALVDENVYLTEWPEAIEGTFKPEFGSLPEPVLITAMAKHERFFPVRGADGKLLQRFISIRNAGEDDPVRAGNEWVLNARFNDAKFFFDEDSKHTLSEFLERTERMAFQEELGSVRKRADRLQVLSEFVAAWSGADETEQAHARKAGLFAKADLSCGLVSELPSLQGIIGGEYARCEGLESAVAHAIAAHYDLAKALPAECDGSRTAVRLLLADQFDKLAGYLGLGLAPSGSSDPYGLRRAATLLIQSAWGWKALTGSFAGPFEKALSLYLEQGYGLDAAKARATFAELLRSRYEPMMPEAQHDLLEAALQGEAALRPRSVRVSLKAMELASRDTALIHAATRPLNIVAAAKKKGIEAVPPADLESMNPKTMDSWEGIELRARLLEALPELTIATKNEDPSRIVFALKRLEGPINAFFDATMVMAEDTVVRDARLGLLAKVNEALLCAGDFSKIVLEGD